MVGDHVRTMKVTVGTTLLTTLIGGNLQQDAPSLHAGTTDCDNDGDYGNVDNMMVTGDGYG